MNDELDNMTPEEETPMEPSTEMPSETPSETPEEPAVGDEEEKM